MSRLWRYGSVYSRTRDFLVGKMNPWETRPIWFDVWTRHPPRRDPVLLERVPINALGYRDRRHPDFNFQQPPNLVYKTDYVRFVDTQNCISFYNCLELTTEKITLIRPSVVLKVNQQYCHYLIALPPEWFKSLSLRCQNLGLI